LTTLTASPFGTHDNNPNGAKIQENKGEKGQSKAQASQKRIGRIGAIHASSCYEKMHAVLY
jgi:uncharacterized protein with von Willebrand factor type A (vWA) domain